MKIDKQQAMWIVALAAIALAALMTFTVQPVDVPHQSANSEDSR